MNYSFHHRAINSKFVSGWGTHHALLAVAVLAMLLLSSSPVSATLTGDASLTYINYNGSADSKDVPGRRNSMSSNSLVQNYSLLYSSSGPIYNSRVGNYNVALGYNWSALDTSFKSSSFKTTTLGSTEFSENYNITRGHLMYKGEINLDPKEVPFKLNAYSRDMTRNTIVSSNGTGLQNLGSIIGVQSQATDINEGLHIESGVTLLAGVKNGMTNGYNEILRHFPMILVDYKDSINRDLQSSSRTDNRLSRLAFVSLNKKDNWFHYRHIKYEDYLDNKNDYYEDEIQLGTVDQYMARRWIDFSNWIKVSTDMQFSKRKSNFQANPIEDINLNLFVTSERQYWNARTFTSFNRYKDERNNLSYQTTLPLYVSGAVSQNTSWNARTSFRNNHDIDAVGVRSSFMNALFGYRVDALKRATFTLSQNFDVETTKIGSSDYTTLSGGLETTSTRYFSRNISLGASYNVRNAFSSKDSVSTSEFYEHRLRLNGNYSVSNTLRFEVRQDNTFTTGTLSAPSGTTRNSATLLNQYVNPRSLTTDEAGTGDSFHSASSLMLTWNPKSRLNVNFTLLEDIYKTAKIEANAVTEVMSGVTFTNDVWSFTDTLKYIRGSRDISDKNAESVSNSATVRYIHSRSLDVSAGASYSTSTVDGISSHGTTFDQRLNYSFFTRTGMTRKLLEINEAIVYQDGTDVSNVLKRSLTLGFRYYPIRQLTLSGGIGYSIFDRFTIKSPSNNDYALVWNTSVVANFRLLQISLDYVSGIRKEYNVRENKFTGNLRKSF